MSVWYSVEYQCTVWNTRIGRYCLYDWVPQVSRVEVKERKEERKKGGL